MKKLVTLATAAALLSVLPATLQARIGEDEKEIEARYGKKRGNGEYGQYALSKAISSYQAKGFDIRVEFNKTTKRSEMEWYRKPPGNALSEDEVAVLMKAFGGDKTWVAKDIATSGIDKYWLSEKACHLTKAEGEYYRHYQGYRDGKGAKLWCLSDDSIYAIVYDWPGMGGALLTIVFMTKEYAKVDQYQRRLEAEREAESKKLKEMEGF